MPAPVRDLRSQAQKMRRAADRLTLLRLRLANSLGELSRSEDAPTRRFGEVLLDRWTGQEYAELGRLSSGLRGAAGRLERAALAEERVSGRRLGGYAGAGFLGRGDDAHRHVDEVAEFIGTREGASIGGYPLAAESAAVLPAHPSHTLGIDTPDYDERDDEG